MGGDWITGTLWSSLLVVRAVMSRPSRVGGWEGVKLTPGRSIYRGQSVEAAGQAL